MTPALEGLSDEEIEALAKLPRVNQESIFSKADGWLAKYKDALAREHAGKFLLLNVDDLTYAVGKNFDDAHKEYVETHGPTPLSGRHFIGIGFYILR